MTSARDIESLLSVGKGEAAALMEPGKPALTHGGLRRHVQETGRTLRALGVARTDRVALVIPSRCEMATAFLGVAAAAVAAPLNPAYRLEEFEFSLRDLGVRALLVEAGGCAPALAAARRLSIPVIELLPGSGAAGLFTLRGSLGAPAPEAPLKPGDLAMVLHTSGTTSRPKIVPQSHLNLSVSTGNVVRTLRLTEQDCSLHVAALFHMHGLITGFLSALAAGGRVYMTPGFNALKFFEWMDDARPTWYTAVPAVHQAILAQAGASSGVLSRRRLRFIRSSSAPLPPTVAARLEEVFGAPVNEAYGMTEAHQICSNPLPPLRSKPGTVGPAAGPEVAIFDEGGNPLPPGRDGEVCIRGDNVMAGYEGHPEANASAFRNGWFRTGDLGALDSEGYLRITARLKEIISRGGEKISPREVDEVLLTHPAVAQALAFAIPHETLGEEVAVAVVLREGSRAGEQELREHLSARLAEYKVPRKVVFLDQLPTGPTGKPQRTGLARELGFARGDRTHSAPYVAPRTPLEKEVAALWSRILGVPQVGVDDNFFDLGGDSLSAARMTRDIQALLRVELPLSLLVQSSTVAGVSLAITELLAQAAGADVMDRLLREVERPERGAH